MWTVILGCVQGFVSNEDCIFTFFSFQNLSTTRPNHPAKHLASSSQLQYEQTQLLLIIHTRLKIWSLRFYPFPQLKGWLLISDIRSGPYIYNVTTPHHFPDQSPPEKNDPTFQSKRNFYRDTSPLDCKRSSTSRAVLLISSSAFGINELCIGGFIPTVNLPPLNVPAPEIRPAIKPLFLRGRTLREGVA